MVTIAKTKAPVPKKRKKKISPNILAQQVSSFNVEQAERICDLLSKGVTRQQICEMPDMPSYPTVYRWERTFPEFRAAVEVAREVGTHFLADECIAIADGIGDPADKRVRIDTRMRLIGKWNARQYGDKVDLNVSGKVIQEHNHIHSSMSPKEAADAYLDSLKAIE